MGYFPSERMIEAINEAGLWHGRASILVRPQVRAAFEEDPYERWEHSILESFGGLYVTAKKSTAKHYAEGAAQAIEGYYWPSAAAEGLYDWAEPVVHRIFLLPGADVALDEDELGWAYLPNEENNWEALGLYHHNVIDLAQKAGVYDLLENQIEALWANLESHLESDPGFLWEPTEDRDTIDELTQAYVGPILEAWLEQWIRFRPHGLQLPNLRLLNQQWYADPPIADRLK